MKRKLSLQRNYYNLIYFFNIDLFRDWFWRRYFNWFIWGWI